MSKSLKKILNDLKFPGGNHIKVFSPVKSLNKVVFNSLLDSVLIQFRFDYFIFFKSRLKIYIVKELKTIKPKT